jgi:exopolysaccharide biosynthesis polyprenyl glycosylphosphotransferase
LKAGHESIANVSQPSGVSPTLTQGQESLASLAASSSPKTRSEISRQTQSRLLIAFLLLSDAIAIGAAFAVAYAVRFKTSLPVFQTVISSPQLYFNLIFILIPFWLLIFAAFGLYNEHNLLGGTREYAKTFNACTVGMMFIITAGFLEPTFVIARAWLLLSWGFTFLFAGGARFLLRRVVYRLRQRGYFLHPTLIIGADGEGKALAEQFHDWPASGLRLIGFLDDSLRPGTEVLNGLRVLGSTRELEALVQKHGVGELVVATTALPRPTLLDIFQAYGTSPAVNIRLSSGLFEILTTGVQVKEMGYVPLVNLNKVRLTGMDVFLKTALDYLITLPAFILISPLLAIIAILVKLDSSGPVLYRRRVLGMGRREIDAFKFRTMVVNADEVLEKNPELKSAFENNFKLQNDPRVTRLGRFLRKHSLDELPQLFNVLLGQMSLVGPRMIAPEEAENYGKWRMNLLTVKPGMSGLWVVSGRSDIPYEERVRLDMHYIRNYTIWLDLHILFRTIPAMLKGRGAY